MEGWQCQAEGALWCPRGMEWQVVDHVTWGHGQRPGCSWGPRDVVPGTLHLVGMVLLWISRNFQVSMNCEEPVFRRPLLRCPLLLQHALRKSLAREASRQGPSLCRWGAELSIRLMLWASFNFEPDSFPRGPCVPGWGRSSTPGSLRLQISCTPGDWDEALVSDWTGPGGASREQAYGGQPGGL